MIVLGYAILGSAFVKISSDNQWILAFVTPLIRETITKILIFFVCKAAGSKSERSVILAKHYVSTKHAIFLTIIVGGVATPDTTYAIIATDFIMAIYQGLRIVRKQRKGINAKGDDITDLLLNLYLSFIPFSFLVI